MTSPLDDQARAAAADTERRLAELRAKGPGHIHITTDDPGAPMLELLTGITAPNIRRCGHLEAVPLQPAYVESWGPAIRCAPCVGPIDPTERPAEAYPCDECDEVVEPGGIVPVTLSYGYYTVRLRQCAACADALTTGLGK